MLLLILGTIGLTLVFSKGRLFASLRADLARVPQLDVQLFAELVSCPACLGTWFGIALGILQGLPLLEVLALGGVVSLGAWFSCGICCSLELLIERLRRK